MIFIDYNRVASRWLVFGIEQVLAGLSFLLAFLISGQLRPMEVSSWGIVLLLSMNAAVTALGMLLMQTHSGIIRYSSIRDVLTVLKFAALQFLLWVAVFKIPGIDWPVFPHPILLFLLNALLASLSMIGFRILIKEVFRLGKTTRQNRYNILIYGANGQGISTMRAVEMESDRKKHVIAFVDDSRDRVRKSISGKRIIPSDPDYLSKFIKNNKVMELILADDSLSLQRKEELLTVCSENGIRPTVIPPISQWINGRIRTRQIKEMTIESILNRESIKLYNEHAVSELNGAVVMVTGAAGSIGSEICRQLSGFQLSKLILLDCSESGLFEIYNELSQTNHNGIELVLGLASIRDQKRVKETMSEHRPDIVYHAAAYKHVPILENFPSEVVQTNVRGTMILAEAAMQNDVRKFVMISTDKAVNPTNLMGASKRLAELYVHSLESSSATQFITTRFGNVLGSNGSVVPVFRRQIEKGGPVTVTHPDITRFFMTIPEASSLVIEASVMGSGGEIFVFDMGRPERILDMARKMIQLAGFKPDEDIRIEFSGLRKGEKLHEELFKSEENPLPTHHPKIMKAHHGPVPKRFEEMLTELVAASTSRDSTHVRTLIRNILPEYNFEQEFKDVDVKILRPLHNAQNQLGKSHSIGTKST